jgi:hypothetical protein
MSDPAAIDAGYLSASYITRKSILGCEVMSLESREGSGVFGSEFYFPKIHGGCRLCYR